MCSLLRVWTGGCEQMVNIHVLYKLVGGLTTAVAVVATLRPGQLMEAMGLITSWLTVFGDVTLCALGLHFVIPLSCTYSCITWLVPKSNFSLSDRKPWTIVRCFDQISLHNL